MTNLKESLAAKRKQVEEDRKAKFDKEKELATAVAGSIIMAPAVQKGSRMIGKPVFVPSPGSSRLRPSVRVLSTCGQLPLPSLFLLTSRLSHALPFSIILSSTLPFPFFPCILSHLPSSRLPFFLLSFSFAPHIPPPPIGKE